MNTPLHLDAHVVSRAGSTAEVVHRRLIRVSEAVNERYGIVLKEAWAVVEEGRLRAEVQLDSCPAGPLDASARVVEMLCELTLRLTPVRCRVLMSPTALPLSKRTVTLQQGAKERLFLKAKGFPEDQDQILTGAFAGLGGQLWDWTERQAQFVRAVLRAGVVEATADGEELQFVPGRKRREVAAAFGVSPSVVTECLQAAEIDRFRYQVWSASTLLASARSSSMSEV